MQNFVHLVLSRFNVQIFDQAQPCSDEWMAKRFDLYLKYSKKSMMSQDCNNYKWVIFLDSRTSEYWVNRFHADLPGGAIIKKISGVWAADKVRNSIDDFLHPGIEWIITTRMDMDDAVSKDFVSAIQSEFKFQHEVLNFAQGFELGGNGQTRWRIHPHNAWSSLVEPFVIGQKPKTIWAVGHTDWVVTGIPIRQVWSGVKWLQVLHDSPHMSGVTSTDFRGIRIPRQFLYKIFDIESEFSRRPDSLLFWPFIAIVDFFSVIRRVVSNKTRFNRFLSIFKSS